jgi:putative SOS response-associated peptidase YedK
VCGRFSLGVDTDRLVAEFGPGAAELPHGPRFNIAPTQDVAAVALGPEGLRFGTLRWGLVPAAARGPARRPLINARSETVARRPSFAQGFQRRRCWILADGFYEWATEPDGSRVPWHISLPDGSPFAFAGLWDRWEGEGGPLLSCAILTTRPAPAVARVHDRMPVILPRSERDAWLRPDADPRHLAAILRPFAGELRVERVSSRVNSFSNDDAACREPLAGSPETSRS